MHNFLRCISPRYGFLDTTTIGFAQDETLLTMMPAFLVVPILFGPMENVVMVVHRAFSCAGALSPVSVSIIIKPILSMLDESTEDTSLYCKVP